MSVCGKNGEETNQKSKKKMLVENMSHLHAKRPPLSMMLRPRAKKI